MILHRKDVQKLADVLEKFKDVEVFELTQDSGSGIGSITTMTFAQDVNGLRGSFEIEISGVEDW
jgi:hypothetical protein